MILPDGIMRILFRDHCSLRHCMTTISVINYLRRNFILLYAGLTAGTLLFRMGFVNMLIIGKNQMPVFMSVLMTD